MAVKIRLKRFGKKRTPFYRVVVMDSHTKRDGRAIEEIGKYHPTEEPSVIEIDSERVLYWLSVGAQPTEQVTALLKLTGDWQKFKGDKGATNTVKPQVAKASPEERIKEAAKGAERLRAAKAQKAEEAAKKAAEEKAEAAKAAAKAESEKVETEKDAAITNDSVVGEGVADESREVPTDEGTEVEVEIAEGDPSDVDDKVEGIIDEAKVEE
jgi:small subunit ribosomal protein S16